jgi:hypothetical protein
VSQQLPDQVAIADLRRQADQRRRHLGVEQPHQGACDRRQHLQVLAGSVQHLANARRCHGGAQRT